MSHGLSPAAMWQAVKNCDAAYDGRFYYGVATTGIYCRPSCKSKTPKEENVRFFFTREEAERSGFRPCKRCRPDLPVRRYNPDEAITDTVQSILDTEYTGPLTLKQVARRVGFSEFHLARLYHAAKGSTFKASLTSRRIERAKELLTRGSPRVVDVGYAVGFGSPSRFYAAFRRHTGHSPQEYRRLNSHPLRGGNGHANQ